jgi:hypothetical protein
MLHSGGDHDSHSTGVRNSWTKLIEDLGLQYNFVGRNAIESGELTSGAYKVFVMPQSIAVSPAEAEQIRAFVRSGGLLIADYRAAHMNEHGRDLGAGQLDDVFGVKRVTARRADAEVQGLGRLGGQELRGRRLRVEGPGEADMALAGGKALAQSGDVPLIVLNEFGSGRAVFLNLEVSRYAYERLQRAIATDLPMILEETLGLASVRSKVRVSMPDGSPARGVERVTFTNGGIEHVAIFRNPQFDDGGWMDFPMLPEAEWSGSIDNAVLEEPAEIEVQWGDARHTYDVRARKQLGATAKQRATLSPWEPLVYTRAAQPIPELQAELPESVRAGDPLKLSFTNAAPLPEGTFRIVRAEFTTPSGESYGLYARNLKFEGAHTETIPLAHNDPKGRWRVNIHDVMTGQVTERAFTVT